MLFVSIDLRPRMSCGNDMHIALSSLLDLVFYVFMCALYTCIWCRDSSLISLSNLTAISCQRFYNIRFDVDSCIIMSVELLTDANGLRLGKQELTFAYW